MSGRAACTKPWRTRLRKRLARWRRCWKGACMRLCWRGAPRRRRRYERARGVYEAMAYQIAKEIGAMATVLEGRLHAIVLAGGLAASAMLVEWIRQRVAFLAPVVVYAGEDEMGALAAGALRVIRGEEAALEY